MKTILVVTYVEFWTKGAGHCARINAMVNYLRNRYKITIFFIGNNRPLKLGEAFPGVDFQFIETDEEVTYKIFKEKFREYIKDRFFQVVLIEYVDLSAVLEFLPPETITILDTHDLVYNKMQSFKEHNIDYGGIVLTKDEEMEIFDYYDYIILIQKNDFEEISQLISAEKLLLVPHPVVIKEKYIVPEAKRIGYVASLYGPNIVALQWFLKNVWPEICLKHKFVLHIYGNITTAFNASDFSNDSGIVFHGYVEYLEPIYDQVDVIINPVKCGAGLKIKNVEALGFGVPLITTTHGSLGIEEGVSKAFLVADTAEEFILAFERINQYQIRKQLSKAALALARDNYSEGRCFASLLEVINKEKPG
jgi:glycosyltransferase involved in cell wall biosynthesis